MKSVLLFGCNNLKKKLQCKITVYITFLYILKIKSVLIYLKNSSVFGGGGGTSTL